MTEPTASPDVTGLLPCPLCGSTDVGLDKAGNNSAYFGHCHDCGVCQDYDNGWSRMEAIAAWNRRVPDLALRQEVERLTRERLNDRLEAAAAFGTERARALRVEASLRLATQRREDVVEALRALIAKLDECQPHIGSAFAMQQLRSGAQYSGPTYADELEAARAALQPKEN